MEAGGDLPFVVAQSINLICLIGWPTLALYAVWQSRLRPMTDTMRLVWTTLILFVPFLGAIAFFLVGPKADRG